MVSAPMLGAVLWESRGWLHAHAKETNKRQMGTVLSATEGENGVIKRVTGKFGTVGEIQKTFPEQNSNSAVT